MPIHATSAIVSSYVPAQYYFPIALALVALAVLRTYAQGRRTNRERDLHDRTILITGAFTPLGLNVVQALAERGARVIALTDAPGPAASLVSIIRQRTQNDDVFAEECDLSSHSSIVEFARQMLARLSDEDGQQQARLDAIVFAHEYAYGSGDGGRAAFLLTTLLLPGLLVAPSQRDIRLIFVVNPFYAAQTTREGTRARRAVILARHLQRVLDALPTEPPIPEPSSSSNPSDAPKKTSSNIAAVAVSPGISRTDTVAPFLRATHAPGRAFSNWGFLLYLMLQPVLRILAKTPAAAIQSVLHTLFLPRAGLADGEGEVLLPGALYADCAVVPFQPDEDVQDEAKGVAIWEELEQALKAWAKQAEEETAAASIAANASDDGRSSVRKRKNKDAKVRWADETEAAASASGEANGDPKPKDD